MGLDGNAVDGKPGHCSGSNGDLKAFKWLAASLKPNSSRAYVDYIELETCAEPCSGPNTIFVQIHLKVPNSD